MADFQLNVKINGIEQTLKSVGDLEKALQATNEQLKDVETNSKEFGFLTNQATNISNVFVAVNENATEFNNSLKSINVSAEQLGNTITNGANIATELDSAGVAANNLNDDIKNTVKSSTSLRTELRKITMELQGLEPGTKRFQELSLRAGELRDQIADTSGVINSLAGTSTERLGKALATTTQIGVAGFQSITAGAALFGVEGEQLQETMVKLQALLNLSQAIETFGGLGDKLTEIRAGFQSLFTSTTAATAATTTNTTATLASTTANTANAVANQADAASSLEDAAAKTVETAATEAATVATTGLGIAMKALPIIAIAAAVGALVYGIYQYNKANDAAAKEEEVRKKNLEDLAKLQKEQVDFVGKEASEFVSLVYQLKNTNAGTKERSKLIKDINKEYGTVFKNLGDEIKFQAALNMAVEDYINLQVNRFKLEKNATYFDQNIAKRVAAENELSQYLKENADLLGTTNIKTTEQFEALVKTERIQKLYNDKYSQIGVTLGVVRSKIDAVNRVNETLNSLGERRSQLLTVENRITKDYTQYITDAGKADVVKTNTTNTLTEAERFALDVIRQRIKIETELAIAKSKATKSIIDDILVEKDIEVKSLKERYAESKKKIEDEIKDATKRNVELTKLQKSYDDFLAVVTTDYDNRIKERNAKEKEEAVKLYSDLVTEHNILQDEIKFGDQNTSDTKAKLRQDEKMSEIEALEYKLANEKLTLNVALDTINEIAKKKKEYNTTQNELDLIAVRTNTKKELDNYQKSLEERLGILFKFDKEGNIIRSTSVEKINGEETEAYDARLKAQQQAEENFLQYKENLAEEAGYTINEINNKWNRKNSEDTKKFEQDTVKAKIEYLNTYYQGVSATLEQIKGTSNQIFIDLIDETFAAIQTFTSLLEQDFATKGEEIAAWATTIGQTINAIVAAFVINNKAALEEDLTNFTIASNERKDQLTREYNQGLINKQQYDAAIKNEDKNLKASELKAKKDAFEQDKKLRIAQATIAGITGAISAFAGAMTLGPIAGPIVGGVLAAAVGVMTGVQIAQIKKQKFDSGGTTVEANVPDTNVAAQINAASSGGFTSFNEGVTGAPTGGTTTTASEGNNYQKVYVLESDITNSQNRVRTLENNASFG